MADETTQYILGDAAVDSLSQPRKRRFFGGKKPAEKLTHCENCGLPLAGEYCSACGQHAIDYRRSIWRVAVDALDSFFNWDTKFLKTVGILLTQPGNLTNDFNAGRRVRYVHPLRLYLLASIAFFLVVKLVNFTGFKDNRPLQLTAEDRAEVDAAVSTLSAPDSPLTPEQRARLEAARARWFAPPDAEAPEKRAAFDRAMMRLPRIAKKKALKGVDMVRFDAALAAMEAVDQKPASGQLSSTVSPSAPPTNTLGPIVQFDEGDDAEPKDNFGKWLQTRIKDRIGEDGTKAQLFFETLRSNVPTMMLACVPLFALVLKLLYIRQRRFYVEHLVYALHIHTFAYVAVVMITLLGMGVNQISPSLQQVLVVILPVVAAAQVFVSIRRVYQQSWLVTTFKFLLGGMVYLTVLSLALIATAFITLLLP